VTVHDAPYIGRGAILNRTAKARSANAAHMQRTRVFVTHNAAVERPRDHASSAPRVHNEMPHMRHARDAV
jgi:hypothetical protein